VESFNDIPSDIEEYLYVDTSSPSLLRWRSNRGNQAKKGEIAGTLRPDGRWRVCFRSKLYYTYRIYIFLTTGASLSGLLVDHKNNNPAIHSPSNLRIATRSQNNANRRPRFNYKGVSFHAKSGLWRARLTVNGRESTSYHKTEIDAARAYDVKALKAHGSFAYLNFPESSNVRPSQ
jgi:hypothetical protein